MKYIIYHRFSSYEKTEDVSAKVRFISERNGLVVHFDDIIVEQADNVASQLSLASLIAKLKTEKSTSHTTTIFCYDLLSLVSTSVTDAINQLTELQKLAQVWFCEIEDQHLRQFMDLIASYRHDYAVDKGKLHNYRLSKNGVTFGRPSIPVDVEKASRLRMEGHSYKEISDRLGQSLSLIYSKMPKEVKQFYPNPKYKRCGRKAKKKVEDSRGDNKAGGETLQ